MVARGLQSTNHPVLAQIVPIRRCNLACTYCNEFDSHSAPVPFATMCERIDHLARLRTANVEISGGEPLLHPDLDGIIRHIRRSGAQPSASFTTGVAGWFRSPANSIRSLKRSG